MEALHVGGTARDFQGVVKRGRWQSGLTDFDAPRVPGVRYALHTLDEADGEQRPSLHLGVN